MKKLTKKECLKIGEEVLKNHEDKSEVFVSEDGQAFFESSLARSHAKKAELKVHTVPSEKASSVDSTDDEALKQLKDDLALKTQALAQAESKVEDLEKEQIGNQNTIDLKEAKIAELEKELNQVKNGVSSLEADLKIKSQEVKDLQSALDKTKQPPKVDKNK